MPNRQVQNTSQSTVKDYQESELSLISDSDEAPAYELAAVKDAIILGDALKVLPKLPAEAYDMVFFRRAL